jgi:predicted ester cyclase
MRSTATRRSAFRLAWKEPNNDLPSWSAFPDLRYTVENITADGDRVVVQFVLEGTQHGEFLGIAPTGKTVRTLGMTSYRFTDERIAEILVLADFITVLRQLGVLPVLPAAPP